MDLLSSVSLLLLAGALFLVALGALRRILLWRRGRPEAVAFWSGLAAIPRRYLVDLHAVVHRDRYMSNTHVATAGGFVLALVIWLLQLLVWQDSLLLDGVLLSASTLMFVGTVFVYRRRLNPPARLSKGPWMRFPKSLMTFAIALFGLTLLKMIASIDGAGTIMGGVLLLVGIAIGLAELVGGIALGGPFKHAFAGSLHLAFHRRPERFGGGRSTGLKPLYVEKVVADGGSLGVGKPEDFAWNQLLGFDACVQCGRCEAVCPAFASGQPLNPKKLIQDLVVGMAGGSDHKYAGSPYPNVPVGKAQGGPHDPIVGGLIAEETLWSCTTCRACVEECPMMIEHVDAIVDMRRFLTMERGITPVKGVETLENLIATDNPGGLPPSSRMHWAADQNLPLIQDRGETDVLYWVSDGAFDMRSQKILRALVGILRAAGVDFAVLGDEERDSGDVARRLGDESAFEALAQANITTLAQYRFNRIVTTDPHAFHCLKNEYPAFGGQYTVLHHTTFIRDLVDTGKLQVDGEKLQSTLGTVSWHDPCYLGRYNGEYDAPRELLRALGLNLVEMERSGFRSRCCGGGGAAPITDIPGERRIADMRMDDVRATGATTVVVGCQQCTAMLEGVVEPRPAVIDIGEVIVSALVQKDTGSVQPTRTKGVTPQRVESDSTELLEEEVV